MPHSLLARRPWPFPVKRIEDRHRFSTLAVCHVLIHPIALVIRPDGLALGRHRGQSPENRRRELMKITGVETYWTRIPFDMGAKPVVMAGLNWQGMNTIWLRILIDAGIDGWGEAFGHGTSAGTLAVLDTQL